MKLDYWTRKLYELAPEEEIKRIFDSPYCEYGNSFIGFTQIYGELANIIPKNKFVIDLGSYAGLQAYFFQNHHAYIGIDRLPFRTDVPNMRWIPRVKIKNGIFIEREIIDYLKEQNTEQRIWLAENAFAIVSYVPLDDDKMQYISDFFPNMACYYPGCPQWQWVRLNGYKYRFDPAELEEL